MTELRGFSGVGGGGREKGSVKSSLDRFLVIKGESERPRAEA